MRIVLDWIGLGLDWSGRGVVWTKNERRVCPVWGVNSDLGLGRESTVPRHLKLGRQSPSTRNVRRLWSNAT